jgi:hypothetical protein
VKKTIVEVGQYWEYLEDGEIVRVDSIENDRVQLTTVKLPIPGSITTPGCPVSNLRRRWKHIPGYNSPLWKVLYG